MTALPMTLDRAATLDPLAAGARPAQYISNGETAENVAEKYNVTGRRWTAWLWRATEGGRRPGRGVF